MASKRSRGSSSGGDDEADDHDDGLVVETAAAPAVSAVSTSGAAADDANPAKRSRMSTALVVRRAEEGAIVAVSDGAPRRASRLEAPVMSLEGHSGPVVCVAFAPDGDLLLSGGRDRTVQLWEAQGSCKNIACLRGHKSGVTAAVWSTDGASAFTSSADKEAAVWSIAEGRRRRRLRGHMEIVNDVSCSRRGIELVLTASDDGTARVWDTRHRRSVATMDHGLPVTACAFADDALSAFTAGLDGVVRQWDLRRASPGERPVVELELRGHLDTVTALTLNAAGTHLLSNATDGTLRSWDVRPYTPGERCRRILTGASHGADQSLLGCAWDPTGRLAAAGGSDRCVTIWDVELARLALRLPGHKAVVNDVAWSPTEPLLASAGGDGIVLLGEVDIPE